MCVYFKWERVREERERERKKLHVTKGGGHFCKNDDKLKIDFVKRKRESKHDCHITTKHALIAAAAAVIFIAAAAAPVAFAAVVFIAAASNSPVSVQPPAMKPKLFFA